MYWREIDLFLVDTGYAKYLKQRETRKFHAFFVLVWEKGTNQSNQTSNNN